MYKESWQSQNKGLVVVAVILLVIVVLVFAPLISIWALNTLFGLQIPFSLSAWFAALWLGHLIHQSRAK